MSQINSDFSLVIKRLELIKNLISLEEEEELEHHITRLQNLVCSSEVTKIVNCLQERMYGTAIILIEDFLTANHQIAVYIDPEVQALKLEVKGLEKKIQLLNDEKSELDKMIFEFGVRHNQELGELILKILQFRKDQSKGTPLEKEANEDYDNFNTEYETTQNEKIESLSDEELKELKSNYRNASKLCHPDLVNDSQRELAGKLFIELNEAYEKNNLVRVSQILADLKKGKAFTSKSDNINAKQELLSELERLKMRLAELNAVINNIKISPAYIRIKNITDWNDYFEKTKQELKEQLIDFENGRK
jgi:hypothetical protein